MCYSIFVEQNLNYLEKMYEAKLDPLSFASYVRLSETNPKKYKDILSSYRIYPNDWALVLVEEKGERWLRPMRYRLRPSWSPEEIPQRYNLFNARLDMLEKRKSWSQIFGRKHGLLIFHAFYEWITNTQGKKQVLRFSPKDQKPMVSPALWDLWTPQESPQNSFLIKDETKSDSIRSFAIITTDPHPDVLSAGHDRTPIFLTKEAALLWLKPTEKSKKELYSILNMQEPTSYAHMFANP